MKKAIEALEAFEPSCEQEEIDKKLFLEMTKVTPNALTRENILAHFSVSAWIMNKERTKMLCGYHKQYDSWMWLGGHTDGDDDFLAVIIKEIEEESGVTDVRLFHDGIFTLESLPVGPHMKRGKFVNAHVHLNVTYAFEADETCETRVKEDENSGVGWLDYDELMRVSRFAWDAGVYKKIIDKVKRLEGK